MFRELVIVFYLKALTLVFFSWVFWQVFWLSPSLLGLPIGLPNSDTCRSKDLVYRRLQLQEQLRFLTRIPLRPWNRIH